MARDEDDLNSVSSSSDDDDSDSDSSCEVVEPKQKKSKSSPGSRQLTLKTCFAGGDVRSSYSVLSAEEILNQIADLRANPPEGYTHCAWPANWVKKPNAATKLGRTLP